MLGKDNKDSFGGKPAQHKRRSQYIILLCLVLILLIQLGISIYYGSKKAGYHLDEMLTYELANYPDAFVSLTDNYFDNWKSSAFYEDVLAVSDDCSFDYSIPYHNQELDVHPPLYYGSLSIVGVGQNKALESVTGQG